MLVSSLRFFFVGEPQHRTALLPLPAQSKINTLQRAHRFALALNRYRKVLFWRCSSTGDMLRSALFAAARVGRRAVVASAIAGRSSRALRVGAPPCLRFVVTVILCVQLELRLRRWRVCGRAEKLRVPASPRRCCNQSAAKPRAEWTCRRLKKLPS